MNPETLLSAGQSLWDESTQPAGPNKASYERMRMPTTSTTPTIRRQIKEVLLIETPGPDRERHAKTLHRHKYKVTVADSVEEARQRWSPAHYGLIVMSVNGFGDSVSTFCGEVRNQDAGQVIALIFHPDQELPATDCPTIIFTTEPDEYFLARVETLTSGTLAA